MAAGALPRQGQRADALRGLLRGLLPRRGLPVRGDVPLQAELQPIGQEGGRPQAAEGRREVREVHLAR
eukprot:1508961-Alexandrium_andersonii.AAC.1